MFYVMLSSRIGHLAMCLHKKLRSVVKAETYSYSLTSPIIIKNARNGRRAPKRHATKSDPTFTNF